MVSLMVKDAEQWVAYVAGWPWASCPFQYQPSLERFFARGIQPGSYLTAVLENDLFEAVMRSDSFAQSGGLQEVCKWLLSYCPCGLYGSPEKLETVRQAIGRMV